jgi:hypothetical protein
MIEVQLTTTDIWQKSFITQVPSQGKCHQDNASGLLPKDAIK